MRLAWSNGRLIQENRIGGEHWFIYLRFAEKVKLLFYICSEGKSRLQQPAVLELSWVCFAVSILIGFWTLMALTGTLTQIDDRRNQSRTMEYLYSCDLHDGGFF